ncbi:MAG: hypothetical protein ABIL01_30550 [Pseudomonadota bacterium]
MILIRQPILWAFGLVVMPMLIGIGLAQAQNKPAVFYFANNTNASIAIRMVEGADRSGFTPRNVLPKSDISIELAPGYHVFDLKAFKAWPPHTHRIGIDAVAGETSMYHLGTARMGLYLLEDAEKLSAMGITPSEPPAEEMFADKLPGGVLASVAGVCQPPFDHWESLVLWISAEQAQYYRRQGNILCGAKGQDLFRQDGPVHSHYICDAGWDRCVRHREGDFRALPGERTTEVVDTAMQLALADDPRAAFSRTQTIITRTDSRQTANMTSYISFHPDKRDVRCPDGHRLHYQGFCISIADEQADDPEAGVRMLPPRP